MSVKFRLIVMNFLQYGVWGAWLISLGAYLGGGLHYSGVEIGSFFATMGIASLFMPALMGIIADRWVPAQKLLGVCHLIAAALMMVAARQQEYVWLYASMLASVMFYMPTISLSNSVAYYSLEKAGLDTVRHFPPIRHRGFYLCDDPGRSARVGAYGGAVVFFGGDRDRTRLVCLYPAALPGEPHAGEEGLGGRDGLAGLHAVP